MHRQERLRFARELYAVHSQIFSGVSFERFVSHVLEPTAECTKIQVYRDFAGKLVGYCAFHRFAREFDGRRTIVLRAEAGLLPKYRGKAIAHWFGMLGALKEKLRHPFLHVIYFGTLVHPSSYRFFCKYFPDVFPRHGAEALPTTFRTAIELAESFGDPTVDPRDPLIREVGWITKNTLEHPALISDDALYDIHYFETRNPGYSKGHGLVVMVPVTFSNVGQAIITRVTEAILGWIRRRPARL
ncbi:hypothetical protein [Marivita geojedonensis]|uniref:hypothetical protein n=1 Tax=Marivita geojedonensis TaxID=1123756 RepID=UPI000D41B676|nr:hypothetical protein [Marivita geojedonensis]PRY71402.1 hypothetical protein CLV76_1442 [Marivita geojedonensis]